MAVERVKIPAGLCLQRSLPVIEGSRVVGFPPLLKFKVA